MRARRDTPGRSIRSLRECCPSVSAKRPNSARSCSMPTRPTGSRVRLGERTPSADRESDVIERRELPPLSRAQTRAGARAVSATNTRRCRRCIRPSSRTASRSIEYARAGTDARAGRARHRDSRHAPARLAAARTCPSMCAARKARTCGFWRRIWRLARDHRPFGRLAPARRRALCVRPQWTFEALEAMSPAQRSRTPAAGRCGADRLAATGFAPERSRARFGRVRASRCRREMPGNVRIYAPGLGFWGWGRSRPPVAWCRCDSLPRPTKSELESNCRDAYNARLLKRSKLLIEV